MGTEDDWYAAATDLQKGTLAWRRYLGSGMGWEDDAMLTKSIGPDALLSSGTYSGIPGVRDAQCFKQQP
jgi:hypothetical protein